MRKHLTLPGPGIISIFLLLPLMTLAQQMEWKSVHEQPATGRLFTLNETGLNPENIRLPMPDGNIIECDCRPSSLVPPALQQKFSSIRVYEGHDAHNPERTIRINTGPKGIHATIFSKEDGMVYIDPESPGKYLSYSVRDYKKSNPWPAIADEIIAHTDAHNTYQRTTSNAGKVRRYTVAIAATGEFTQYHGGTVADGLSAIVTILNRVEEIYKRDLAITFTLADDNDLIIFTDGTNDPFSNNSAGALIDESQEVIDSLIGNDNYDMGHVFSTGGGGLAFLGSVCEPGAKAKGVTGLPEPIGDPFAVDYVAHEFGHQFGATHTFNGVNGGCGANRSSITAYEPGSGSTIMAYAGLCGSDNIQLAADPYFHTASLDQMVTYINSFGNCAAETPIDNTAPSISHISPDLLSVPMSTPFILSAGATDSEDNLLTFSWEQYNLGAARAQSQQPTDNGPVFSSQAPQLEGSRDFPFGVTSATDRNYTFRLTVRDNNPDGGAFVNDYFLDYSFLSSAGPFRLSAGTDTLQHSVPELLQWDVAGTAAPPIDCEWLKIELFGSAETLIIDSVANDGEHLILLPSTLEGLAGIRLSAIDNIFYTEKDITVIPPVDEVCASFLNSPLVTCGTQDTFQLSLIWSGAQLPVSWGSNSSIIFNTPDIILATDTLDVIISDIPVGKSTFYLYAEEIDTLFFTLTNLNYPAPEPILPDQQMISPDTLQLFTWSGEKDDNYQINIYDDEGMSVFREFTDGDTLIFLDDDLLLPGLIYSWEVVSENICRNVTSANRPEFSTTFRQTVEYTSNEGGSIPDNGTARFFHSITPNAAAELESVELQMTHTWLEDLDIFLKAPDENPQILFDQDCFLSDYEDNFLLRFQDGQTSVCPPHFRSEYFQPVNAIRSFPASSGTWELIITDNLFLDEGELISWTLIFNQNTPVNIDAVTAQPTSASVWFSDVSFDSVTYTADVNGLQLGVIETSPFEITGLMPNTTYTVNLFFETQGLSGKVSETFTTPQYTSVEDADILVYPNPSSGTFSTPDTDVRIVDIRGKQRDASYYINGNRREYYGLPKGIYFVIMNETTIKLLIQ